MSAAFFLLGVVLGMTLAAIVIDYRLSARRRREDYQKAVAEGCTIWSPTGPRPGSHPAAPPPPEVVKPTREGVLASMAAGYITLEQAREFVVDGTISINDYRREKNRRNPN